MPNKRSALIETQALFGTRQRVVPLQGMKMIHSTMTSFEGICQCFFNHACLIIFEYFYVGRTHPRHDILLTSPSLKWGAYVADKKGRFEELRLWDYLFYRP